MSPEQMAELLKKNLSKEQFEELYHMLDQEGLYEAVLERIQESQPELFQNPDESAFARMMDDQQ